MPTSILDFLTKLPSPIPANAIPYWDWCDWTLITLPANGINSCEDVEACITAAGGSFITWLLTSSNDSIVLNNGDIIINAVVLQSLINVNLVGTLLTVGWTTVDLNSAIQTAYFTIFDGANSTQINFSDMLTLVWADWLLFTIPANNVIQIGLPVNRQHMQVLTWDAINQVAYRENNQCCAQTLSFDTATNILSLSGTNAVDLTSINTDNQELAINGNILSITQLNSGPQAIDLWNVNEHTLGIAVGPAPITSTNLLTIYGSDGLPNWLPVDLTNVNEHTLHLNGNLLEILWSDGMVNATVDLSHVDQHQLAIYGNWECPYDPLDPGQVEIAIEDSTGTEINRVTIPRPAITCCQDVMACSWIQDIVANLVVLTNRIINLENAVQLIQGQLP